MIEGYNHLNPLVCMINHQLLLLLANINQLTNRYYPYRVGISLINQHLPSLNLSLTISNRSITSVNHYLTILSHYLTILKPLLSITIVNHYLTILNPYHSLTMVLSSPSSRIARTAGGRATSTGSAGQTEAAAEQGQHGSAWVSMGQLGSLQRVRDGWSYLL